MTVQEINDFLSGNPNTKVDLAILKELAKSNNKEAKAAALMFIFTLSVNSTVNFPALKGVFMDRLMNSKNPEMIDIYSKAIDDLQAMLKRKGEVTPNYVFLQDFLKEAFKIPKTEGVEFFMLKGIYERHPELSSLKVPLSKIVSGFKNAFDGKIDKGVVACATIEHVTPAVREACGIIGDSLNIGSVDYHDVHKGRQPSGHFLLPRIYDSKNSQRSILRQHGGIIAQPIQAFLESASKFL